MSLVHPDDGYRSGHGESVQVSTLIPVPIREKLRACARKAGVGIQDYLRDLIARDLGLEQISASLPPHAKAVVSVPELPPAVEPAPVESILSLIERGFTAQQIAAMRRMPYRQVLAELGKQVDIKTAGGTLECDGARALSDKGHKFHAAVAGSTLNKAYG